MTYHPDRNHSPDATKKFQEINEAKEVLADPNRRAAYDQVYWARLRGEYFEEPDEDAWDPDDYQDYQWEEDSRAQSSGSDYSWSNGQGSQEGHRNSRGSGYRWNGNHSNGGGHRRGWHSGSWWEEGTREAQPEEPPMEETRQKVHSSRFFLLALIAFLVDRFSPDPDESQRILPWPSWAWQRTSLIAGLPLASLVFLMSVAQGAWALVVLLALWFAAAVYCGITTRWMRASRQAQPWVRFSGGACIIGSGVGYTLALAYATLLIAMMVAAFLIMGVVLRAMLDDTLNRR
jgi:hypothetical protein